MVCTLSKNSNALESERHQVLQTPHMVMLTNRLSSIPLTDGVRLLKRCLASSGKSISNIQHHSVPTSLRKAKTFLEDEYLREITAASDDHCFYFKPNAAIAAYFQGRRFRQQLYMCRRKGWILQPYFSLDVQNLQVYPL